MRLWETFIDIPSTDWQVTSKQYSFGHWRRRLVYTSPHCDCLVLPHPASSSCQNILPVPKMYDLINSSWQLLSLWENINIVGFVFAFSCIDESVFVCRFDFCNMHLFCTISIPLYYYLHPHRGTQLGNLELQTHIPHNHYTWSLHISHVTSGGLG